MITINFDENESQKGNIKKVFNHKHFITFYNNKKFFTYFKNSGDYAIRPMPGESAVFSMDEFSQFLTIVKSELLKEIKDDKDI